MAEETISENPDERNKQASIDIEKPKEIKKDKSRTATKIVIRRLPPSMTEETFIEQVSPLPEHDYLYFVRADLSLGSAAFSRAYLNFLNQEDILTFRDQYDSYIFVDKTGNEYPAVVEFAPFQRLPKKRAIRRKDIKAGTIEEDPAYIAFLQSLEEDIKDKENEHAFDYSYKPPDNDGKKVTTTPLLEFLKQRRAERQRSRDERKEDRRKKEREREIERRKSRDDEKRRKRPDSKDKDTTTGTGITGSKQVLKHTSISDEKDGSITKTGKEKEVPVQLKQHGERKREDEKSSYNDKKYNDNRVRDKPPGLKPNQTGRPKPFDSRPQQNRRSVEDLRKKPQSKSSEMQHSQDHGNNTRKNYGTTDSKKPPNKYQERDKNFSTVSSRESNTTGSNYQGSLKNRDREPRKNGRDYETRKNFKDEPRRNGDKKRFDADHKKEATAVETSAPNQETRESKITEIDKNPVDAELDKTKNSGGSTTSKSDTVVHRFRRFSLGGENAREDTLEPMQKSKPLCKSVENINTFESQKELVRLTGEEYSKNSHSESIDLKDARKDQSVKANFKKPYPIDSYSKASSTSKAFLKDKHGSDKLRRSSLDSGKDDRLVKSSKYSSSNDRGVIRRNHSLELETSDGLEGGSEDRSREESVESSNDGEHKGRLRDKDGSKTDQRPERRIKNKDRPSIEIYRPGMGRFSKQRIDPNKE